MLIEYFRCYIAVNCWKKETDSKSILRRREKIKITYKNMALRSQNSAKGIILLKQGRQKHQQTINQKEA